jgi:hypothetical protein
MNNQSTIEKMKQMRLTAMAEMHYTNINNNIQELKRRKVFTSAGLYAFSSFIIMQVVAIIVPTLMLPEWTDRLHNHERQG